jgi:hypothetical protein
MADKGGAINNNARIVWIQAVFLVVIIYLLK